jgi:hypothetical protein
MMAGAVVSWASVLLLVGGTLGGALRGAQAGLPAGRVHAAAGALGAQLARLPLSFERNVGQSDRQVQFLAHLAGGTLFLTHTEAVLVLAAPGARTVSARAGSGRARASRPGRESVLRLRLVGANAHAPLVGRERLPGQVNYLLGNQPQRWHTHVPTYAQVAYHNVYQGADLLYSGTREQLTYDFVLAPGARPGAIRLAVAGARRLTLDRTGALLLASGAGTLRQEQPRAYQVLGGQRRAIAVRYVLHGQSQVGLAVGRYDARQPLLIDPAVRLSYSTYLGSSTNDEGQGIAVDGSGNAYVTGFTDSGTPGTTPFPTTPGAFQTANPGGQQAFVTKLNASGSALVYSTYLGSTGDSAGTGIALDGRGHAYVTGFTDSPTFPTTPGAFQTTYGGGHFDAFVTKLNARGSALVYSTYLGGSGEDEGQGIAVDGSGNAYVTGRTDSTNFPTTPGAFQTANAGLFDAFVAKLRQVRRP